jgi:hypothetical protein
MQNSNVHFTNNDIFEYLKNDSRYSSIDDDMLKGLITDGIKQFRDANPNIETVLKQTGQYKFPRWMFFFKNAKGESDYTILKNYIDYRLFDNNENWMGKMNLYDRNEDRGGGKKSRKSRRKHLRTRRRKNARSYRIRR